MTFFGGAEVSKKSDNLFAAWIFRTSLLRAPGNRWCLIAFARSYPLLSTRPPCATLFLLEHDLSCIASHIEFLILSGAFEHTSTPLKPYVKSQSKLSPLRWNWRRSRFVFQNSPSQWLHFQPWTAESNPKWMFGFVILLVSFQNHF